MSGGVLLRGEPIAANLTACATLAVSMAACKAGANARQYKVCQYVAELAEISRVGIRDLLQQQQ